MRLLIFFFFFSCISNLLHSQISEFESSINISVDVNAPDSIQNKVDVIFEIVKIDEHLVQLFGEETFKAPEYVSEEDANDKISKLTLKILNEFSEQYATPYLTSLLEYYLDNFTIQEIIEIKELYETPLGAKLRLTHLNLMSEYAKASKELTKIKKENFDETFPQKKSKKKKRKN